MISIFLKSLNLESRFGCWKKIIYLTVFKRHEAHIVWLKHNLNGQRYSRNENIGYKLWAFSPFKSVLLG